MRDWLRVRIRAIITRFQRVDHYDRRELQRWLETTRNLIHLSVLLFVPLLIGAVTVLLNSVEGLSFLLFPPLAAGTYMLFTDPEGRYSSPLRFTAGLTIGALCGWIALEVGYVLYGGLPPAELGVWAAGAVGAVFLTGAMTWAFDVEQPAAFSTALLALLAIDARHLYVLSVLISTAVVAGVFMVWRSRFYEQRARYLYQSTKGDDHVLVPMRGTHAEATAVLGARLAAAHDAGKVVLLDVVDDTEVAETERALLDEAAREADVDIATDGGPDTLDHGTEESSRAQAEERVAAQVASEIENHAAWIERELTVPCEVVVAVGDASSAQSVLETARTESCDLIVAPYEAADESGSISPFVTQLLENNVDVLVHRSIDGCTDWQRVMVAVRRDSTIAHTMIDFGERLVGSMGELSVCHCIDDGRDLRTAERMLADLVETCGCAIQTRVSRSAIEEFLGTYATQYDLVVVGASTDRSAASRFLFPPTFERLNDIDCDVAIVA